MSQSAKACCDDLINRIGSQQDEIRRKIRENEGDAVRLQIQFETMDSVIATIWKYKKAMYE